MDWKELEKIIGENQRETNYVEATKLGGVVLPLIKLKGLDLFLWGLDTSFDPLISYLRANDMSVKGIICPDKQINVYAGIPIITPEDIRKMKGQSIFVIVTHPDYFYDDRPTIQSLTYKLVKWIWHSIKIREIACKYEKHNIIKMLKRCGVQNYYFPGREEFAEISLVNSSVNYNRISYYNDHLCELKSTYDMLYDRISKESMLEFIRAFIQNGMYRAKECDGRNKYFAGYGRGKNTELLYEHKEDEIWVNCGAYVGDTILLYLADGYKAKKIYAFEGSKNIYKSLCRTIGQLPETLSSNIFPVNIFISEKTNWSSVIKEKITLINADIEGNELELLRSMKNRIESDRPVLAICVYHLKEDLIEIPEFIDNTVNDYIYILRKYPASKINAMRTSELVLYAIPKERLCVK